MKRRRSPRPTLDAMMREVARRPPARGTPAVDDDCPLCRLVAGQAPVESLELPDGSFIEIHALPASAVRGEDAPDGAAKA